MSGKSKTLSDFKKGQRLRIVSLDPENPSGMCQRLSEMGFIQGEEIEIKHEAPLGKDPLAVEVRGGLVAIGRSAAECVYVEEIIL